MLQYRASIACAAVAFSLLSSRQADAQFFIAPPQRGPVNDVVTGVQYDIVNQKKAVSRLGQVQARLDRDAARGNVVAADRDVRRIKNLQFRITVDEWLIRQNSLVDPGCYPYPVQIDPLSCAVIGQYARPRQYPY